MSPRAVKLSVRPKAPVDHFSLLAFLCAEPSDYCFDFFSGTLEAHEGEI